MRKTTHARGTITRKIWYARGRRSTTASGSPTHSGERTSSTSLAVASQEPSRITTPIKITITITGESQMTTSSTLSGQSMETTTTTMDWTAAGLATSTSSRSPLNRTTTMSEMKTGLTYCLGAIKTSFLNPTRLSLLNSKRKGIIKEEKK